MMRFFRKLLISLTLAVLYLLLLHGCSDPYYKLHHGYALQMVRESGNVYLYKKNDESEQAGGILDGVVLQIGWNDSYIVAFVDRLWNGDVDGFYVIDVAKESTSGPYTEKEITDRADLKAIVLKGGYTYFDSH